MPTNEDKIASAIVERHGSTYTAEVVRRIPKVLDGELAVVTVYDENGEWFSENYVYLDGKGKIGDTFLGIDEAVSWASSQTARPAPRSWVEVALDFVPAIIAILILLTIIAIVLAGVFSSSGTTVGDVPEVLSLSLTTIVGFYFGTAAGKRAATAGDNTSQGSSE